jgi:hypothetical protein
MLVIQQKKKKHIRYNENVKHKNGKICFTKKIVALTSGLYI